MFIKRSTKWHISWHVWMMGSQVSTEQYICFYSWCRTNHLLMQGNYLRKDYMHVFLLKLKYPVKSAIWLQLFYLKSKMIWFLQQLMATCKPPDKLLILYIFSYINQLFYEIVCSSRQFIFETSRLAPFIQYPPNSPNVSLQCPMGISLSQWNHYSFELLGFCLYCYNHFSLDLIMYSERPEITISSLVLLELFVFYFWIAVQQFPSWSFQWCVNFPYEV